MTALRESEADFMRTVTELAELFGWSWVHFRPARTAHGWRTPVSGPMGTGWPDLLMVRGKRLIVAELKRDGGKPTPEQVRVLDLLGVAAEAYVWRPADWSAVEAALR